MRLLHLWALLLLLCLPLATGCKDITKAGQPSIRLQSDVLAFRVAVIGQSQAKNIVLQNEGTADLKLSSVSTGIDAAVLQLGAPNGGTRLSFDVDDLHVAARKQDRSRGRGQRERRYQAQGNKHRGKAQCRHGGPPV